MDSQEQIQQQQQQEQQQQQQQQQSVPGQPTLPAFAGINPGGAGVVAGVMQQLQPRSHGLPQGHMQQPFMFGNLPQFQVGIVAPPSRPRQRPSRSAAGSGGRKPCNCKNSRCLKLYCECFSSGRYCDNCNCNNCCNNRDHEDLRQQSIEATLERNPNAFRPKIAANADIPAAAAAPAAGPRHNKGCNCRKSGCLKRYCECFQAGIACGENCKCVDCKNYEGSIERTYIIALDARTKAASTSGRSGGGGSRNQASMRVAGPTGKADGAAPSAPLMHAAPSQATLQSAVKDALRESITPQIVDQLAVLLTMLVQEEADRQSALKKEQDAAKAAAGGDDKAKLGDDTVQSGVSEEQEKLVLRELRDLLMSVNKVVREKSDARIREAQQRQSAYAALLAVQQTQQGQAGTSAAMLMSQMQQAHQQQVPAHQLQQQMQQQQMQPQAQPQQPQPQPQPHQTMGGGQQTQFQPYVQSQPVPPGMTPVVYQPPGGQPQLVLVPQSILAPQMSMQQPGAGTSEQQQQQMQQVPQQVPQHSVMDLDQVNA